MKHLLLSSLFFVAACSSPSGRDGHGGGGGGSGGGTAGSGGSGGAGGSGGSGGGTAGGTANGGGGTTDDCSGAAKLIYVVDENMTLYSFTPNQTDITQSTFATIGNISCPGAAAPGSWEAFSMGVDRNATAWVELQDTFAGVPIGTGTSLFSVSTADASCTATSFTPGAQGFDEFGMGFATNAAMSTDETLYIFGGASVDGTSSSSLGSLDTTSMNVTSLASNLTGSPELTGNAL
ncbi:MAG TPA: hypothetical protein VHB97_08380, partial [Polyangia bacterium]|nr:hypothetical protein [Polyangia bacterium]